jgi:PAS domain S-box-containing protein
MALRLTQFVGALSSGNMEGISNTIDAGLAHDVRALCGLDFDTSPVPMWIHDRKTLAFVAVNSATVAYYGFSRTEFLQMTMLDIRPPEDVPRILKDVLYPHFHDPDGDLRRHRTKKGKLIHVGIKAYKLMFNDRDVEVVVVDVAPHSRDGRSFGNPS